MFFKPVDNQQVGRKWSFPIIIWRVFLLIALVLTLAYWAKTAGMSSDLNLLAKSKSAQELYSHAKQLDTNGKFKLGEQYLKKALMLDPNFYKASLELGCLYYENGDFMKAIPLYEKGEQNAGGDKDNYEIALYNLGKSYFVENRLEEAWD